MRWFPGFTRSSAIYTPDTSGSNTWFTSTGVYEQAVQSQAFGANDVYEQRIGDGTTSLIAQLPTPACRLRLDRQSDLC